MAVDRPQQHVIQSFAFRRAQADGVDFCRRGIDKLAELDGRNRHTDDHGHGKNRHHMQKRQNAGKMYKAGKQSARPRPPTRVAYPPLPGTALVDRQWSLRPKT